MICPYCSIAYHGEIMQDFTTSPVMAGEYWVIILRKCPSCKKVNLSMEVYRLNFLNVYVREASILIYPRTASRSPCSPDVPQEFAEDYNEACIILELSPKASAALSRRCLQHVLREKGKVKHGNLNNEIDEILKSNSLPSHIAESLHAIRAIGNFAAHATADIKSGEILPVEVGEAEWTLDILDSLFDHYFINPAKTAKRKDAVNKKLVDAGKHPLK
jgi:hypothetical protein